MYILCRYFKTLDNLINVFDWKLSTLFMETDSTDRILKTPVMTGDVFTIRTTFLNAIGNYDEGFEKGGGENLELSFRAWMCGGSIAVIPCSRVAVRDALKIHEISHEPNFRRVADLWLGPKYRRSAYQTAQISMDMSENERQSQHSRQKYLEKTVGTCSSFHTYLKDVATQVLLPNDASRGFGKLRARTGYCIHSQLYSDTRIQMRHCLPHMYEPNLVYRLDLGGRLVYDEHCIDASSQPVTLKACQDNLNAQVWSLQPDGQLQSVNDQTKCLAHSYADDGTNFLDFKECSDDRAFQWSFVKY